jgi:hypothetical protein
MGFGLTTVLLNMINAGLLSPDGLGVVLPMGIFYGGLAQVIAGLLEARNGNTFGATAFTSYGLFWWSFVSIKILPGLGLIPEPSAAAVGSYLLAWGVFTALMTAATFRGPRTLQLVFVTLSALFFILSLGDLTGSQILRLIGGYEGIFCGSAAVYLAIAEIINEMYGRTVMPVG